MWTEEDDREIKYGKWHRYTAKTTRAEENKVHPPEGEVWPHWSQGIPTKLRKRVRSPSFFLEGVYHQPFDYMQSLELEWSNPYLLSRLKENRALLPGDYTSEWSGVYRIFSPNTTIDRYCGKDPTGTLYLGRSGTGRAKWSILRTRINELVNGRHHAPSNWSVLIEQKYPRASLAVEWAYTPGELNHKGQPFSKAILAENFLLSCYGDSFGELPPWNR
jgi:hypothetical protein